MSSKIIKLRESESTSKTQNADYKIVLDKSVEMMDGDELRIKSCFIDTVSSTGDFIEISDDVNIEIDVGKYFINDSKDQTFPAPNAAQRLKTYVPVPGGTIQTTGDALPYFACNKLTTTANTEVLKEFALFPIHFGLGKVGGFDLHFVYNKVGGGQGYFNHHVIKEDGSDYPRHKGKRTETKIYMEGKSFSLINADEAHKHGLDPKQFTFTYDTQPGAGEDFADIDTQTFSFTLPAGVYSPTQLGEIITDKMTVIDSLGPIGNDLPNEVYPVNNPFLTTVSQLISNAGASTSFFCNVEGTQFIKFNDIGDMRTRGIDRFMGGSEISLQFDAEHKKMSFSILHLPIYVNETHGANDAVAGLVYDNNKLIDTYSGCFFTRLSPPDFWTNLGFEGVVVSPKLGDIIADAGGVMGANIRAIEVGIEKGKNRTAGFQSIDTPVQKNTNFRAPNPAGEISTSATIPIFGERVFADDFSSEGYYLIEIDCGVAQDLIGATGHIGFNSTKIHSIVSTYFSEGNYTSDQGSGSVGYIHKGSPIILSNFNVRVLQSDGTVPDPNNIGGHNTIFLELVRKGIN